MPGKQYFIEIVDKETQDVIQSIGPKYTHDRAWEIYDTLQTPDNLGTLDIKFVTEEKDGE